MSAYVSACYFYPLKSGQGVSTDNLQLTEKGPKFDRVWMLVDETGKFISQRTRGCEKLALVAPNVGEASISFSAPGMDNIRIDATEYNFDSKDVSVWGSDCKGYDAGDQAAQWFQDYLGIDCRLVAYANNEPRAVDSNYGQSGDTVSFADGMPLLVTSEPSLEKLREHFPDGIEIGMERFRANIVIRGLEAFEEDVIHHLRIGDVELEFVKPCARCILTTVDQDKGERLTGNEPVTTLTKTRRGMGDNLKGVFFGQNAIARVLGTVRVGDKVDIISKRPLHPALENVAVGYHAK